MFPCNHFPIQPFGILQAHANAICILLRIPSYPSPLERHRNIWPIMGWREVINATSRNAPACATCAHNCLTQLASCRSLSPTDNQKYPSMLRLERCKPKSTMIPLVTDYPRPTS
ncbi:hypothetical protein O181_007480 [Austropuccinia psidii MF-1]|uniref:Uncharacterized protein n=1 Tax=Austropuccinia psidii MF-1 TaxID=1389203 RepID=A0A9Q3BMH3_9BASI|nr:hypothetical protein [Austropuccinia psidii MF-1]